MFTGRHSATTKKKISRAHKGRIFSTEHRERLRQASIAAWKNPALRQKMTTALTIKNRQPEHRKKVSQGRLRWHQNNPYPDTIRHAVALANSKRVFSPAQRAVVSQRFRGVPKTLGHRKKIGLATATRYRENRGYIFKHYQQTYRGQTFRSSWEVEVAKYLSRHRIKWQYEPQIFYKGNARYYIPDFFLPEKNIWVEVKGWKTRDSMAKATWFSRTHNLIIIDDIKQIRSVLSCCA